RRTRAVPSAAVQSAIDMQRLAGHIGAGIRDEIAYCAGYILAGTEAVHRNAARERLTLLLVECLGHVRGDEAGRDRVGGNAARGHFERERAREPFDARLGGAIIGL